MLHNFRKHMAEAGRPVAADFIDPHSTAVYFAGLEKNPLPSPRFWFLTRGWSLAGPIDVGRIRVGATGSAPI